LEELKKIKFRNEYNENQQIQQQASHNQNFYCPNLENNNANNQESKAFNLNQFTNTNESNILLNNNLNNLNINNNNCLTEISVHNNLINNTTGKKRIVRMSTFQPDVFQNPMLMQPINMRYRQSKANVNNNIIKNITRKSTLVLNNLGFGLAAFRKSIYDPSGATPVLCQMCNNLYYAFIMPITLEPLRNLLISE